MQLLSKLTKVNLSVNSFLKKLIMLQYVVMNFKCSAHKLVLGFTLPVAVLHGDDGAVLAVELFAAVAEEA